jgi:hypothetical protein
MKRTLYRRLHKQARHSTHRTSWRAVTAVWTVSDPEVPRWSPGDGWIEVATARMWVQATDSHKGLMCTCLVHAWHRSDANPGSTDHPVLLSGATEFPEAVADKPHRFDSLAEPGSLVSEPLTADHPALIYERYHMAAADRLDKVLQRGPWGLSLSWDCELHPCGKAWVFSLLIDLAPGGVEYWEDLARATDVIAACSRHLHQPHVRIYPEDAHRLTDPLWYAGGTVLNLGGLLPPEVHNPYTTA